MENLEQMMRSLITLYLIGFFIISILLAIYDYMLKVGFEKINKRLDAGGFPKEEEDEREKTSSELTEPLDQKEEDKE